MRCSATSTMNVATESPKNVSALMVLSSIQASESSTNAISLSMLIAETAQNCVSLIDVDKSCLLIEMFHRDAKGKERFLPTQEWLLRSSRPNNMLHFLHLRRRWIHWEQMYWWTSLRRILGNLRVARDGEPRGMHWSCERTQRRIPMPQGEEQEWRIGSDRRSSSLFTSRWLSEILRVSQWNRTTRVGLHDRRSLQRRNQTLWRTRKRSRMVISMICCFYSVIQWKFLLFSYHYSEDWYKDNGDKN